MFQIDDPKFRELVEHGISLDRLVKRLRPESEHSRLDSEKKEHDDFDFSKAGFLGVDENLLEVVYQDWLAVEKYGTTHKEIANALREAIESKSVPNLRYKMASRAPSLGFQLCPWNCHDSGNAMIPIYKVDEMDEAEIMYHLFLGAYPDALKIMQEAKDDLGKECAKDMAKALARYPSVGKDVSDKLAIVTELHPHLIEEHYFFEGRKSFYRADPAFLIDALNLAKAPRT